MISRPSEPVVVSLGSNLGDRRANLERAVRSLRETPGLEGLAVSRIHVTRAWGGPSGQRDFFNAAVRIDAASVAPRALLERLLVIESETGRVRTVRNGPRTLDLDILLFGDRVVDEPGLCIPHRRMHQRSFVLLPAAEVAPSLEHPVLGSTLAELARGVGRDGVIEVLPETDWCHAVGHSHGL